MIASEPLIPKHGGYRQLKTFQLAQFVYDVTGRFCDRYVDRRTRTHDQMVQAARSGVQNIAEGSQAKRYLEEDGTQTDQRGPRQSGRVASRLRGFPETAAVAPVEPERPASRRTGHAPLRHRRRSGCLGAGRV